MAPSFSSKKKQTLQEYFDAYINECRYARRLREETLRGYTEVFRNFLAIMPTVTDPALLSSETISEFFYRLQVRKRTVGKNSKRTGIKNSTAKTYWSKLNSFFEWLYLKKLIAENPLSAIPPPEVTYDDKKALERADIHKIIAAIMLHSVNPLICKRDLMMIGLLLFCGLRRRELISLQIMDVNIESRVVSVRGETSKSKRTRQIPLNPTLLMYMQEYLNERKKTCYTTPYLIVSNNQDKGLSSYGLKHWVQRLNKQSGVRFHVHRFRHSFACNLARQNISAIKIQKLMGHTDLRMTERYVRSLTVDDFRNDINKMNIDNLM